MAPQVELSWPEVHGLVDQMIGRHNMDKYVGVYGVPRGGNVVAALVSAYAEIPQLSQPERDCLVVDDLIDSGTTHLHYGERGHTFDALLTKKQDDPIGRPHYSEWIVFPWEQGEESGPTDAVRRLLQHVGEDPDRDGLVRTPERVVKALSEMTSGYNVDVAGILGVQFEQGDNPYAGIVALRDIEFTSLCEHHMLPFTGTASVAYIPQPDGKIVGLSKLARLVDAYAHRLQVQERLTLQIVDALEQHLQPHAAACVIHAEHSCMQHRGVRKHTGGMVTSEVRGAFKDDPRARAELMHLLA